MKDGEFPDGARTLRAKIDMASPNIWMRDPAALPHPPRRPSSHRRQMVHLSDVRFRALPERLHRRHHAQHLHAGIRGASPALRLDSGKPRPAAPAAASIRIRPAQPRLHHHEQAQAHAARERKARHRLGRSAHAHHFAASAGAASPPKPCAHFAFNIGITKYNGLTDVAVLEHAIREDLNKRALRRLGRAAPHQGGHHQLSRRQGRGTGRRQQSRGRERRQARRFRSAANCTSSRTISWKCRRRNFSG